VEKTAAALGAVVVFLGYGIRVFLIHALIELRRDEGTVLPFLFPV
jgi:hypothetical protein